MSSRLPGPVCAAMGVWMDPGTLCRGMSPRPIVLGVARVAYISANRLVDNELRRMREDIDAALDHISSLPEHARKTAAYNFFASFFDHYLPKKFLHQYVWGGGNPLVLSEIEMIDVNPYINVNNCKAFRDELTKLADSKSSSRSEIIITCPAAALTNGTLGQFSVPMRATLTYRGPTDWELAGKMSFYDEWDFDPKDFSTGGRSFQGEIKTRFAHYTLPGSGFKITSPEVDFVQRATDRMVDWKGGVPTLVPDKIAQLDVDLKNLE